MNSLLKFVRPSAGGCLAPGVPFSSRLTHNTKFTLPAAALNNHDFIREWVARRAAKAVLAARRAR